MFATKASAAKTKGWQGLMPATLGCACQVSLIDRRTGRAHRVGGRPVVVFTSDPQAAVIELLSGRDARLWEARIEPLDAYALQ
jgi:hypothetical protein